MGNSVKNWDDGEPLERSLPVVNWDFNGFLQKLGRLQREAPKIQLSYDDTNRHI